MKHLISLLCLFFIACNGGNKTTENIISVTIEPQRYFTERIVGDKFIINSIVPSGQSPETYDPTPQQMIQIGKSLAYFQIGFIGFEQAWMDNIKKNNPNLEVFDLSENMQLLQSPEIEECEHGEGEHHHHEGPDPHIWNSISGAKTIAANILKALQTLDKENSDYYQKNYEELLVEIDSTAQTIKQSLQNIPSKTFIIYHPALTYFAAENGLTQLCIEMDGKEPSPAQLKDLVKAAHDNDAKVVFIQQEFDQKNAELIAKETGCNLVRINPLDYNWSKEMTLIAKALSNE